MGEADSEQGVGTKDVAGVTSLGGDAEIAADRRRVELEPRELLRIDRRAQDRDVALAAIEHVDELGTLRELLSRGLGPGLERDRIIADDAQLDRLPVARELGEHVLQHPPALE